MKSWLVRAYYAAAWFGIAVGIIGFTTLGYWRVAPYNGLVNVKQPFPVAQEVVYKAQLITYTMSYCVEQEVPLPITVHRSIELQNINRDAPVGSLPIAPALEYEIMERCESRDFFIGIPMYVPAGVYHVHTQTSLQVNPVREIKQSWISENFSIAPGIAPHEASAHVPNDSQVLDEFLLLQRPATPGAKSKNPHPEPVPSPK